MRLVSESPARLAVDRLRIRTRACACTAQTRSGEQAIEMESGSPYEFV